MMFRKAVVLLRQNTAKVRDDEQESSQACMSGTSLQLKAKSSIHYKLCPYTRRSRTERHVFTPGGLPCAPESRVRRKLAEGRATCSDRMEEVSRGHNVAGGNEMREILRDNRNRCLTPVKGPNGARTEWDG